MDALLLMILLPGLYDPETHKCDPNTAVLSNSLVDPNDLELEGTWITACQNNYLSFECPAGTYIDVMEAYYGINNDTCGNHNQQIYCSSPETCGIVRKRCNKKQKCLILASNEEFGDSCPGIVKSLQIKYKCLPVQDQFERSELLCEGKTRNISCPKGTYIIVKDAFYGRDNRNTCPSNLNLNTQCSASSAFQIIKNSCHMKHRCTLFAHKSMFGDPCPWTHKYLHVDYHCADYNDLDTKKKIICQQSSTNIACPPGSKISIVEAFYGRRDRFTCSEAQMDDIQCSATNTTNLVTASCNNKEECYLYSSNSIYGDPCRGITKYLEVDYKCVIDISGGNTDKIHDETICEDSTKSISCPSGSQILVTDAIYGRTDRTTCPHVSIFTTSCKAAKSMEIISRTCNYKRNCSLSAVNSVFGDPCIGTHKYIHVRYICISDDTLQYVIDSNSQKNYKLEEVTVCEHNSMTLKCPSGSHILVSEANYGRTDEGLCGGGTNVNCASSSSLDMVNRLCNYRNECDLRADNTVFGDPCSGTVKYLNVKYFCEIDADLKNTITQTTCEHETMKISCPRGSLISIKHGQFGRVSRTTCSNAAMHHVNCISDGAMDIISNRCNYKEECTLFASITVFGDACVNTSKYLQVDYQCVSVGSPEIKRTTVCDADLNMFVCPKNTYIKIFKLEHKKSYNTCPYVQSSDRTEYHDGCNIDGAVDVISEMCEHKELCVITRNGRPCYGTMKDLQIYYECVPGFMKRNVLLEEHSADNHTQIRCPFGSSLRILDANYGLPKIMEPGRVVEWTSGCTSDKARDIVSGRCDHKSTCLISAENTVFGDPCVGKTKYASVDYICPEDQTKHAVACEYSALELDCPEGSLIRILKAFYGRSHPFICNNSPTPKWPKGCSSPAAPFELYKACEGRRYCSIKPENSVFGDPCVGTEMYLEADYICEATDGPQIITTTNLEKSEPLRNVTFYVRNFTLEISKNFVVQIKKSDQTEWQTALDGNTLDLGVPRSITGLKTGTAYDIRVIRKDKINSSNCQSFVRVTTWPWINVK